jgi:hypothetical protein
MCGGIPPRPNVVVHIYAPGTTLALRYVFFKITNLNTRPQRSNTEKAPVRTAKETPHFTVTKIDRLTLFKEIIAAYSENHKKSIKTKQTVTDS